MDIRVGFVVCGVHAEVRDILGRPMVDAQLVDSAFNALENAGLNIYRVGGVLSRSEEFEEALQEIQEQNVDCVIFYVATWLWASEIWRAAHPFSRPMAIWCAPTSIGWATGGALVLHGALDEIGVKHKLIYGYPDEEKTIVDVMAFVKAAAAVERLKNSKIGLIGGYGMGAITGTIDIAQILSKFGMKVEHADQYELIKRAETFPRKNVEDAYCKLKKRYGNMPELDRVTERSIRLYLALKDVALERKFDITSVKCFPELGDNYATACLAQSLLPEESVVILASDGAAPPSLAASPSRIVLKLGV